MRAAHAFLAALLTICPIAGQTDPSARERAVEELLSVRDSAEQLETAIRRARSAGVAEQAILEARFLYHVDHREDAKIVAMLPEFLKRNESFRLEDSAIFAAREDWLAVIEYVRALASLEKGDKAAFKKHITEAFWLSPGQADAYAPHIERLRLREAMASVKLDFNAKHPLLSGNQSASLSSILGTNKALLLHFWSPWNPQSEASIPDFLTTASSLAGHDISVASVLPEPTDEHIADARSMIREFKTSDSGAWITDTSDRKLGTLLRIRSLPTMAIVSRQGTVLFNGDPTDDEFWSALAAISPGVVRPSANTDPGE